jgi:hypothetical protein
VVILAALAFPCIDRRAWYTNEEYKPMVASARHELQSATLHSERREKQPTSSAIASIVVRERDCSESTPPFIMSTNVDATTV